MTGTRQRTPARSPRLRGDPGFADLVERSFTDPFRRLLTWRAGTDGRAVMLAAVVIYLGAIATARLGWDVDAWPALGVPSGPSLYVDARNVTAAWECHRLGYDPLYESPCDPLGRPLNYPRAWLLLAGFGLDQSHTFVIGSALVAAMFLTFSLLLGRVPIGTGVVMSLALVSPAIMFAVERANMDIALFSLVALSALVWRAFPSAARVASPLLVLLAAMAKVYGVFALPAFILTRNRAAIRTALLSVAAFIIYAAATVHDLTRIAEIAPQGVLYSYGARILPAHLYHQVGADHWAGPAVVKQLIAAVPLVLIAGTAALWVRRRVAPAADDPPPTTAPLLALHLGALIYLGTFTVGNNFDYRLVFLLLTLPQLLRWGMTPTHPLSSLSLAALAAIVTLLWVGSLSEVLSLWDEAASWVVTGVLAAILAATIRPVNVAVP